MALTNDTGTTGLPVQLGQGQSVINQYGISVTGGSTVNPSPTYVSQPGTSMSKVYMGPVVKRENQGPTYGPVGFGGGGNLDFTGSEELTYEEARMAPLSWSEAKRRDFISKGILYKIPGFDADMGMPEVMSAWDDMVKASQAYTTETSKWSPWDVMNSYQKDAKSGTIKSKDGDWLLDAATGEKIKYIGPKTKTTTDKKIDLSSAEDVKAITTQMLTELLGRAPSSEELAKYRASINGYEGANPLNTVTTSHLDDRGEVVSQDTTSSGGVTDAARQSLIQGQVVGTDEFGKYQSGTTYFNALMQMLGG